MPKNRNKLVIQVSNLELDAAFKKWMGTSPVEINGVNNRIGYWTLKSWLSIPEKNRPEGSDNDLRYNYAIRKWSEFQRAIRADKRSQGQRRPSKQRKRKKNKRYKQQAKVKQLLAKKNWGLPRQVFEEVGVILTKVNVTEEDVSTLATEIKQAFKTQKHNFFPGEGAINFFGLGSLKNWARLLKTVGERPLEYTKRDSENVEKRKLRESNPEVRASKKYGILQKVAGFVLLPSLAKVLIGMGYLGLWEVFNTFFKKTVYYEMIKGFVGTTVAPYIAGVGSWLVALLLMVVIYRVLFQRFYISKLEKNPEKSPQYDPIAAKIYEGYDTPKKHAKDYQNRVNLVLEQDISPDEKKDKILELWADFNNEIAPSIDKGEYLRGYQEGARYLDFLKRGSQEEPKPEGFVFYLGFREVAQQIQLEREIPNIIEENKGELVKEMKAILSGKRKVPQQILDSIKAEVASIQV